MSNERGDRLNVEEAETVQKLYECSTQKEAARELHLTLAGLKYRVSVLRRKTGQPSVQRICVWAYRRGLLKDRDEPDE